MKIDELVLLSRDRDILHIVSGHSVFGTLRASGTPSTNVVVWYDVLRIGPTRGATLEETTRLRNRFFRKTIESCPLKDEAYPPPSLAKRNLALRHCGEWREVILWFGPSVTEQFSLLQILAAIAEQDPSATRLTLATCPKLGMGIYRPVDMSGFFKSRAPISREQITFAEKAWELYCGSDPMPLFSFARTHAQSNPVLCNALLRQLGQYPSARNGLSLSEEALVRQVELGGKVLGAVADVIVNDDEFLFGDQELFDSLLELLLCEAPLIQPVKKGSKIKSFLEFRKLEVKLSSVGKDVLAGRSDNVTLNGVDRWIGGVHLKGKRVAWRWDSESHTLKTC
jgi:hypothetical protein